MTIQHTKQILEMQNDHNKLQNKCKEMQNT